MSVITSRVTPESLPIVNDAPPGELQASSTSIVEVNPDSPDQALAQYEAETKKQQALLDFIRQRTFVLNYKTRYRVGMGWFMAMDMKTAVRAAETYCTNNTLKFISVHPSYIDLAAKPKPRFESDQD